jgi:hypothetical protein
MATAVRVARAILDLAEASWSWSAQEGDDVGQHLDSDAVVWFAEARWKRRPIDTAQNREIHRLRIQADSATAAAFAEVAS